LHFCVVNDTEILCQEPCRVCGELKGIRLAEVEYWDLRRSALVRCPACGHMQLDPMLTEEETAKGCLAYYLEESQRVSPREQERNRIRNFRRGVMFGFTLKRRGIVPARVLELGPGSGYFAAGLQFVFPDARVTVMDVNADVLAFNAGHHGYETIRQIPDKVEEDLIGLFDLVIARDILEHVSDIAAAISNIGRYLVTGGLFHFITPNGREDAWKHILAARLGRQPSELLINHVNYFDGAGLKKLLEEKGFTVLSYYTYTFKFFLRGNGWRKNPKLMSPHSTQRSAGQLIRDHEETSPAFGASKEEILKKWYIRRGAKKITYLYSIYQHCPILRADPGMNIGHEIYGLFRKEI